MTLKFTIGSTDFDGNLISFNFPRSGQVTVTFKVTAGRGPVDHIPSLDRDQQAGQPRDACNDQMNQKREHQHKFIRKAPGS